MRTTCLHNKVEEMVKLFGYFAFFVQQAVAKAYS